MKTSKITVIGLLICLTSIFYHNDYWLGIAGFESMPELARIAFPIGIIITLIGLFVDRPYGDEDEGNAIEKTICPNCGKKHDIDYPKCPYCKHQYT